MVLNSSSRRTIGQDRVSTTRDNTAILDNASGMAVLVTAIRSCVAGYEETAWIAQKSLAKYGPLIGELSPLTLDPVRYW